MAYPSSDPDIEQSMQTRCSNCLTVFEVSRELLASSDTRVRCGECLSIFDAREGLREEDAARDEMPIGKVSDLKVTDINSPNFVGNPDESSDSPGEDAAGADVVGADLTDTESASLAGLSTDTAALDVTYSDFDLFSEDADLPEIAYFDQTRDTASFDFDTVSLEHDETFSDTLFAHDVTIDANVAQVGPSEPTVVEATDVEFVGSSVPAEPLIFNYRDADPVASARVDPLTEGSQSDIEADFEADLDNDGGNESEPLEFQNIGDDAKRPVPWLLSSLMFITLVIVIGGMYVSREFASVSKIPIARPFLEAGCAVFRCKVPPLVDLTALSAVQRKAFSHPTADNALVLTMGIRNDAAFEQTLPILVISLSDRNGRTVAKRDFLPKDYFEAWQPGDTIPPGKRLDVTLEVKDPGNRATGFELQFLSLP